MSKLPATVSRKLLTKRQVSDATFLAAKNKFGEKGVVDIIGLSDW
jgi:hypothetical protein